MNILLLLPVLLPFLGGACLPLWHPGEKGRRIYVAALVICNALLVFALIFFVKPQGVLTLVRFTDKLNISLRMDGLGMVFAALVSFLWPLACFYAFEYMSHEHHKTRFFTLYTMTYGVTMGIALSANLITMYFFYELLTLVTLPLVMHEMDHRAIRAGKKYLTYSIGGAAAAFIGIMIVYTFSPTLDFTYGGVINPALVGERGTTVLWGYLLTFFGFGVKAAVFPFFGWLPSAGVAPTPVTALLHAVAVVKAGVFAIMRVTFYSFGPALLAGTWAQHTAMVFAMFTIVFGSAMAWKEQHMKRRLAYSTVSNLSYIVFGVVLMTPAGLTGALSHMLFHGVMKICLFFCAGAIMHQTGREFVTETVGLGKAMPKTMAAFTVASAALTGVPLLCGFASKYQLATAAATAGTPFAFAGIIALLISAVLTAAYLFTVVIGAYFPGRDFDMASVKDCHDPNGLMTVPLAILCVAMLVLGVASVPLVNVLGDIAAGLF